MGNVLRVNLEIHMKLYVMEIFYGKGLNGSNWKWKNLSGMLWGIEGLKSNLPKR